MSGTITINSTDLANAIKPQLLQMPEITQQPYSYIIYTDGTTVYAKNGYTGQIDFKGSDASAVMQNVLNALTNGGKIFIKNGDYIFTKRVFGYRSVVIEGESMYNTRIIDNVDWTGTSYPTYGVITLAPEASVIDFVHIRNLSIVKTDPLPATSTGVALAVGFNGYVKKAIVENVYVYGMKYGVFTNAVLLFAENIIGESVQQNTISAWLNCKKVVMRNIIHIAYPTEVADDAVSINPAKNSTVDYVLIDGLYADFTPAPSFHGWGAVDIAGFYDASAGIGNSYDHIQLRNITSIGGRLLAAGSYYSSINRLELDGFKCYDTTKADQAWVGDGITITAPYKNQVIKNVTIRNGVLEKLYSRGILINVGESGTAPTPVPWSIVQDVLIENVMIKNCGVVPGGDPYCIKLALSSPSANPYLRRVYIHNVEVYDDQATPTTQYWLGFYVVGAGQQILDQVRIDTVKIAGLANSTVDGLNPSYIEYAYNLIGATQPLTRASDKAVFSGDGVTTQFKIAHGLISTPNKIMVTPGSGDAKGVFYVTADSTYIYVNYSTAPPSGTNNIVLYWYAEI